MSLVFAIWLSILLFEDLLVTVSIRLGTVSERLHIFFFAYKDHLLCVRQTTYFNKIKFVRLVILDFSFLISYFEH